MRSAAQPAAILTMALAPWLMPSMTPKAMVDKPRKPVTYRGRIADTDSEETSVTILTMPSHRITGDKRNGTSLDSAVPMPCGLSRLPPLRSEREIYICALIRRRVQAAQKLEARAACPRS